MIFNFKHEQYKDLVDLIGYQSLGDKTETQYCRFFYTILSLRYEQDKAHKRFADGIDLVGHPSRKLFVETQYCEVYKT